MANRILPLLPEHHTYVEVFGGSGALLFAKKPAPVEVYNDLDEGLVGFFRALQDARKFAKFLRIVEAMPQARAEYNRCRADWGAETDEVRRAAMWFYVARNSFSGKFAGGWSYSVSKSDRGMAAGSSAWLSVVDRLPDFHARLMRVQIEQMDFRKLIPRYDTVGTLFYLDPPYLPETRKGGEYAHETVREDHVELVSLLKSIRGEAVLSGYPNDLYSALEEQGWACGEISRPCCISGRVRGNRLKADPSLGTADHRTECLWLSPGLKS